MSVELTMLVYVTLVFFATVVVAAVSRGLEVGIPALAGARDTLTEPGRFCARAQRVAQNHIEGLLFFAPLVLAAEMSGAANETTALASQIYVGSRIGHAVLYLIGVPYLRTLVWVVGLVALGMITAQLLF